MTTDRFLHMRCERCGEMAWIPEGSRVCFGCQNRKWAIVGVVIVAVICIAAVVLIGLGVV